MHPEPNQSGRSSTRAMGLRVMLRTAVLCTGLLASGVMAQTVTTLGGGRNFPTFAGYRDNCISTNALFSNPTGTALDSRGNLYVADSGNRAIRKMWTPTNVIDGYTSTLLKLTNLTPVGVAVDESDVLYILTTEDAAVRTYDLTTSRFVTTNTFASAPTALALARDGGGTAFLTLSNGAVCSLSRAGTVRTLTTQFKKPAGIAWIPVGLLAVSDAGNNSIWWLDPQTGESYWLTGLTNSPAGFADGTYHVAQFSQPMGVASAGDGTLLVADRGNNRVRVVYPDGYVQTLYGMDSRYWVNNGWRDSVYGPPEARSPVSVTLSPDGVAFVTESYYHLVRMVGGSGLSSSVPQPTTPAFIPSCGYYVTPIQITVTNDLGYCYYTTDGSEPNPVTSTYLPTPGGIGTINWFDTENDLSSIRIKAFYGTNASDTAFGEVCPPTTPTIYPQSGFYPNGRIISVSNSVGVVFYTTNNTEPNIHSPYVTMRNGVGYIYWSNTVHDLSWLRVKAINAVDPLNPSSASPTVVGRSIRVTTPTFYPTCGFYQGLVWVTNEVGNVYYTTDGTEPTIDSPQLDMSLGYSSFYWESTNTLGSLRLKAFGAVDNHSPTVAGQQLCEATTPDFGPVSGYYPNGTTIWVTNQSGTIHYTTDGSEPTLNSPIATQLPDGRTFIRWFDPAHDLSYLRVKAFSGSSSSPTLSGEPVQVNSIGVPRNIVAGIGSTVVVPVVVNLAAGQELRSLQFRFEVVPNTSQITGAGPILGLELSTNSFVPVGAGTSDGNTGTYRTQTYRIGQTSGVQYDCIATNLLIKSYGVVANFQVPLPRDGVEGNTYTLNILAASGTSDAGQTAIALTTLPAATLTISNAFYLAGDCAPGVWYNAEDFGNGFLDNADVNMAFLASIGIRTPYPFTDAFNAMDVYPETDTIIGDGMLTFLDWQHILQRSLGLETINWMRGWGPGGVRVHYRPGTNRPADSVNNSLKAAAASSAPLDWVRHALVAIGTATNVAPGSVCSMPVYANVLAGFNLAGLQFRASVTADGSAPAPGAAQFVPASSMPVPMMRALPLASEVGCAWSLGSLTSPLQRSNLLGYLTFQVPAGSQAGQSYTAHLSYQGGAADYETELALETASGQAWVLSGPSRPHHVVSEQWVTNYFGTLTNPDADSEADPDHDGIPNWQEYLAGTNPLDAESRLEFSGLDVSSGITPAGLALGWQSKIGRLYVVERSSSLAGPWTAVATNVLGDGALKAFTETNFANQSQFYRIRLQQP